MRPRHSYAYMHRIASQLEGSVPRSPCNHHPRKHPSWSGTHAHKQALANIVKGSDVCEVHISDGFLAVHRCLLQALADIAHEEEPPSRKGGVGAAAGMCAHGKVRAALARMRGAPTDPLRISPLASHFAVLSQSGYGVWLYHTVCAPWSDILVGQARALPAKQSLS
jgi:hypothetical protein